MKPMFCAVCYNATGEYHVVLREYPRMRGKYVKALAIAEATRAKWAADYPNADVTITAIPLPCVVCEGNS